MNLEALKQTLESLDINPDEIEDEIYAKVFRILFAIIEILSEEIDALKSENQKLRDEINLLKGEQTKPKIRGSKKKSLFNFFWFFSNFKRTIEFHPNLLN